MLLQPLSGTWQFRQTQTEDWLPAQVPGGVHTDLLALERIPDPFVGDNEKKVMWVAEQDWEYRRTFTVNADLLAEEKVFLVCNGLDTLAEVYFRLGKKREALQTIDKALALDPEDAYLKSQRDRFEK